MKRWLFLFILFTQVHAGLLDRNPTILLIGDSHSNGLFGSTMEKNLKTISSRVIIQSSCGSSASTWLGKSGNEKTVCGFWKKDGKDEFRSASFKNPKLSEELVVYKPDLTIVQLGTNMAAMDKPERAQSSIEEVLKLIKDSGSDCLWIGPPDANSKVVTKEKLKIMNALLMESTKKFQCHYIDSLKITQFKKGDAMGVHFLKADYEKWANDVSRITLEIFR